MRRKFKFFLKIAMLGVLFAFTNVLYAQRNITGLVKDAKDGSPVPGVNLLVKGTSVGAVTDGNGNFQIAVPSGANTIVVSSVGYKTQEITLTDAQTNYEVLLENDSQELSELVVTALGIKREKKALGYSMQEVKGDKMAETRDPNIMNSLSGKIAGLQVRQASTGPSGSSRIVIRGNNSIGSNNQPLVVVDGMPISSGTGGTDDYWGNRNVDRGSGMADLSPDDIESISVLKGPAASALYGSRAGNGVIMITTKSGKSKSGLGIVLNSNTTFDTPIELPKFQNRYGQGTNGAFDVGSGGSWGGIMDGSTVNALMGAKAYSPNGNDLYKDFLRTGVTTSNSAELTTGNNVGSLRIGISRTDNKNVVPNSNFQKTSFDIRSTGKWSKLSADVKLNYIHQTTNNRIKLASDPDNIFLNYLQMPRSVSMSDYENYKATGYAFTLHGAPASFISNYGGMSRNPYWSAYRNTNSDVKDRLIGFLSLQYDFTSWLNLRMRYGLDYSGSTFSDRLATGTPYWFTSGYSGDYRVIQDISHEHNADFLLTAQREIFNKVKGVLSLGGNLMRYNSTYELAQAQGLYIPDWYTIKNGVEEVGDYTQKKKEIRSFYSSLSLSYDDWAYLDVTARRDISSTLNPDNRTYFYPSIGASVLLSNILEKAGVSITQLNYAKLRASWAEVGNDTDPYSLYDYYTIDIINGNLDAKPSDTKANYNLKPEKVKSVELGLDISMFKNRLRADFTYYKKNAFNQIIKLSVPPATGYKYELINAGNVENQGVEILLSGIPIQKNNFTWDVTVNFTKNNNKIVKLTETTKVQVLSDASVGFLNVVAKEGSKYGDIYGYTYQRNNEGKIIVDASGVPLKSNDMSKLGNYQPDWMMGISNGFKLYNFELNLLIDMRMGGKTYMGSIRSGATSGTLEMTLDGREGFVVPNSVTQANTPNTTSVTSQNYWNGISAITEAWMYDATNVCFRELSVGYSIPKSIAQKMKLGGVKVSLVGRNLFMLYSKTKGFNPEGTYTTGNAQGIELGTMPLLRSIGFNVNLTF